MDKARGGYYESVPKVKPATAWFTNDDRNCDYSC